MLQPANVDFEVTRGDDSEIVFAFTDEAGDPLRLPASGLWVMRVQEKYEPSDEYTLQGRVLNNTVTFDLAAEANVVNSHYIIRHVAKNTRVNTYALGHMNVRAVK